jgi:hypothetical protein
MTKQERLVQYYEDLCRTLNENGFRSEKGRRYESDFKVDYDNPELTMMSITREPEAYEFLLKKGLIKEDMCQFCGEMPVDGTYTFSQPRFGSVLNICQNCHPQGKKSSSAGNSGCMLILLLPAMLATFLFLVITYMLE